MQGLSRQTFRSASFVARTFVAASLVVAIAATAVARDETCTGSVAPAFNGYVRVGRWAEYRVTLFNESKDGIHGQLEVSGFDGDGIEVEYRQPYASRQIAESGTKTNVAVVVRVGPFDSELRFRLKSEDGATLWQETVRLRRAEKSKTLLPTQMPIATLGASIGVGELALSSDRGDTEAIVDVALPSVEDLPLDVRGYDAIDVLAVPTTGRMFESLDAQRMAALQEWVRGGGTLWMTAAESAEKVLAPDSPWHALFAADFVKLGRIRKSGSLEQLASQPFKIADDAAEEKLPKIAHVAVRDGKAEYVESSTGDDRPLIARFPVGFGQTCLTTIDLDRSPFAGWAGRPAMLRGMLESRTARMRKTTPVVANRATQLGFRDLSGQLRAAIDRFQGAGSGAFTLVGVVIVGYLLLLGPGDYFLLRRFGRQSMHLTWFTFPLLALATSAGAIWLSLSTRSDRPVVHPFEVCDIDASTGALRGRSWASVYSPRTAAFDVKLVPGDAGLLGESFRGDAFWMGLPGPGLGGLETRTLLPPFQTPYRVSVGDKPKIDALPIQADGSKPLAAMWSAHVNCQSVGELRTPAPGRLEGELTNPLPIALQDVWIIYDGRYYPMGRPWAPGGALTVTGIWPSNLEARLRRRDVADGKEKTQPWDVESTDVSRVAEMCFFFDAAGGREYTGLSHRYLAELDLSALQRQERAVVVGRIDRPLTVWSTGDTDLETEDSRSYVRILAPVRRAYPSSK